MQGKEQSYRRRNDSVAAFVDDCCVLAPELRVNRKRWYAAYHEWAEEAGLRPVSRQRAFGRAREDYGCRDRKSNGVFFLEGIALQEEAGS